MNTLKILQDVEAHLDEQFSDIAIELYPDTPETYRLNHAKGAILIGYQGSLFNESEDITFVNQSCVLSLHFTVIARSQWGDAGALTYLGRLRDALAGLTPTNCKKGYLVRDGFIASAGGIWSYQLIANFETYHIQSLPIKNI